MQGKVVFAGYSRLCRASVLQSHGYWQTNEQHHDFSLRNGRTLTETCSGRGIFTFIGWIKQSSHYFYSKQDVFQKKTAREWEWAWPPLSVEPHRAAARILAPTAHVHWGAAGRCWVGGLLRGKKPKPVIYSPEVSSRWTGWGTSGCKRERSHLVGTLDPDKEPSFLDISYEAAQMSSLSLQ